VKYYPDNSIQGVFQGSKWEFEGYIPWKRLYSTQKATVSATMLSIMSGLPSDHCALGHLMYQLRFRSFKEVHSNQIHAIAILEYFIRCHRLKRDFFILYLSSIHFDNALSFSGPIYYFQTREEMEAIQLNTKKKMKYPSQLYNLFIL